MSNSNASTQDLVKDLGVTFNNQQLTGLVTVAHKKGNKDDYAVAEIIFPFGEVSCFDKRFMDIQPGTYLGEFFLEKLFVKANNWNGKLICSLGCKISQLQLGQLLKPAEQNQAGFQSQSAQSGFKQQSAQQEGFKQSA